MLPSVRLPALLGPALLGPALLGRPSLAGLALAALLLARSVTAQGAPAAGSPPAGSPPAGNAPAAGGSALSPTDQKYLATNAQGSAYDFTLAELGVLRGSTPAVRGYARQVVTDHARLNLGLLELAQRKNVDVPVTLSADDGARLQRLTGLRGADFDRAFIAEEVRLNAEDVADADKELRATNSADVKRLVGEFRRTESRHLAGARALQSK